MNLYVLHILLNTLDLSPDCIYYMLASAYQTLQTHTTGGPIRATTRSQELIAAILVIACVSTGHKTARFSSYPEVALGSALRKISLFLTETCHIDLRRANLLVIANFCDALQPKNTFNDKLTLLKKHI